MYSVVILTLNEEKALPGCLESLSSLDDIVILDSGSNDATVRLAEERGARIFNRKFDDFAGQRNYAQLEIAFKHPWVLHLDADERMTPELDAECRRVSAADGPDGYRIAPKMIFDGVWVRHCTDYPAYQARLVRAKRFKFIQVGHGQRESEEMAVGNLKASYLHDMSIYGREAWISKHRRYAAAEAESLLKDSREVGLAKLLSSDPLVRRRTLKRLSFALPFRPALRFIYQYVLRMGFLDGAAGFSYCLLLSRYEGFIAEEIGRRKGKN